HISRWRGSCEGVYLPSGLDVGCGSAEHVLVFPLSTFAFVLRRVDQLFAADPGRPPALLLLCTGRNDRRAGGLALAGSNYLAGTAPKRRRLRKAAASDAGHVVLLACARTPR